MATSIDPTISTNTPTYSKKNIITVVVPKIKNKIFDIKYLFILNTVIKVYHQEMRVASGSCSSC